MFGSLNCNIKEKQGQTFFSYKSGEDFDDKICINPLVKNFSVHEYEMNYGSYMEKGNVNLEVMLNKVADQELYDSVKVV